MHCVLIGVHATQLSIVSCAAGAAAAFRTCLFTDHTLGGKVENKQPNLFLWSAHKCHQCHNYSRTSLCTHSLWQRPMLSDKACLYIKILISVVSSFQWNKFAFSQQEYHIRACTCVSVLVVSACESCCTWPTELHADGYSCQAKAAGSSLSFCVNLTVGKRSILSGQQWDFCIFWEMINENTGREKRIM